MAFKLFGSNGNKKSHKSQHKKHNKAHHRRHHHQDEDEEDPTLHRKQRASNVSERHVDSPRVAARKLLMSIMTECEQGNDDDSFDAPPMECTSNRANLRARNVVAPELPSYNANCESKSLYTEDDMKPLLQQMGDSDDDDEEEEEACSPRPRPTTRPPKEIFHGSMQKVPHQKMMEVDNNKLKKSSPEQRLSQNEERSQEFKVLMSKFKPLDEPSEKPGESPAEKERQNIYDMEWFAKVEKQMKSPLRRNCGDGDMDTGDLLGTDTPTTHDLEESISVEGLPDAPLLSDNDSVSNNMNNNNNRELLRMRTSDSCMQSKNDPIYRQQSCTGDIATSYSVLFEAARRAKPVFEEMMNTIFDRVCGGSTTEDTMIARFAELKGQDRAREKAQKRYSGRDPGPALSWLYDIVRGSVLFTSPEAPMKCIEALQQHPDVSVVNIQNKYAHDDDSLEGYKMLNLHLQIDTQLGFQHVCEMQIHHLDVETLFLEQVDKATLDDLLENRMTIKQLEKLSYLFSDQLCRYDWAEVVLHKLLLVQVGKLGHGHLKDADTYRRIGTILNQHMHRPLEAVEMFEKELEILEMHLGIHDMKVAEASAQIGDILHGQGDTEQSLEYYGKAVEILQLQQDKKQYSWVNVTQKDISTLMSTEEEVRESLEMYTKSLDKYKMTVEEGLSNLHRIFEDMQQNQARGENLDQVIQKHNESIDECQRTLLEEYIVPECHSFAEAAKAQGKIDEVFEVYAKSLIQSYQLRKLHQEVVVVPESETKEEEAV